LKFIDINKHIKNNLLPVYLVTGDDSFLISQTISIFKKTVITELEDLNYNYFDGESQNISLVLNACNGLPFASKKKLVIAKLQNPLLKDDFELLKMYLSNPNPTTVLLLVSQVLDKTKLTNFEEIDCSKLDQNTLLKLIASRFNNYGKSITRSAGILLAQKTDNNAMKVVNEITKLNFYVSGDIVTDDDVNQLVSDSFDLNIYNLTNALAEKNSTLTLKILNDMLWAKTEPSQIIGAISNSFKRMFISIISTGHTNEQIAQELKVKPYAIVKAKQTAQKFSVKNLKRINELLEEIDFKLKSGKMSAENCVYYLIFNILTV
jgi:DNA polymerase-3 subunit delta